MLDVNKLRETADKNYLRRYNEYIKDMENSIIEAADNGFYLVETYLFKLQCGEWIGTPLEEWYNELINNGMKVEIVETEDEIHFKFDWSK